MDRVVAAPDGRTWTVRRRWLHRPRWDASEPTGSDLADALVWAPTDALDSPGAVVTAVALTVLLLALLVFALPAILFLAGLVVALGGLAARVLAIRPWTIEALSEDERLRWDVRGWRRSNRVLEEVASALAVGATDVRPEGAVYRARGV